MIEKAAVLNRLPQIIREVQAEIRWRQGSAVRHLLKRKLRGHLPANATLADYEETIQRVLATSNATVYLYRHQDNVYPTVVCSLDGDVWLVMFSLDAIMETAFVIENPDSYLQPALFERIGSLDEVINGTR